MLAEQPLLVKARRQVGQVADGQVHLATLQRGLRVAVGHGQRGERHTWGRIAQARQQPGQEKRLAEVGEEQREMPAVHRRVEP